MSRAVIAAAIAGAIAAVATPAVADLACPVDARSSWIALTVDADAALPSAEVMAQLRAELARQAIEVCLASSGATGSIASVRFTGDDLGGVAVVVDDRITRTALERHIAPAGLSPRGRALAAAIAAAELLRASWAHLSDRPAPPTVASAVVVPAAAGVRAPAARPAIVRRWTLSLAAAADAYTGGQRHIGSDVRLGRATSDRTAAIVGLGYRRAAAADAVDGSVDGDGAFVSVAGVFVPVRRPWGELRVGGRATAGRIAFHAAPVAGASGADASAWVMVGAAELALAVGIGDALRAIAVASAGTPLRSVRLADAGRGFSAMSGGALGAALGLEGAF